MERSRSSAPGWRRALRDRLLFPLLLFYLGVLMLAALPREVRPGLLDAPHAAATKMLHVAGVESGIVVFHDLYGSDVNFISAAQQIGRVALADIPEEDKRKILGENARGIFKL